MLCYRIKNNFVITTVQMKLYHQWGILNNMLPDQFQKL